MEWNKIELDWLNKRRDFLESSDFTDIRIELYREWSLSLHEKKHLIAGLSLVLGLEIVLEVDKSSGSTTRTRLVVLDPQGGKQRLAINSYGVNPKIESVIEDYSSDLKDIGCSESLISKIKDKLKVEYK